LAGAGLAMSRISGSISESWQGWAGALATMRKAVMMLVSEV
jgi:hypothetical protein